MTFTKIAWLAPEAVRLSADARGLTLEYQGVTTPGLSPVRAFPPSAPGGVVALRDAARRTVALIEDAGALDAHARGVLEAELAAQVFAPEILAVEALSYDDGGYAWRVRTNVGPRAFRTRQSWNALPVATEPGGALTILGDDGVRYRIPDPDRLDPASLRLLFPVV